jgi:hypothetical protein
LWGPSTGVESVHRKLFVALRKNPPDLSGGLVGLSSVRLGRFLCHGGQESTSEGQATTGLPNVGLAIDTIPLEGVSKFKMLGVENQAISQVFWFWPIILPKGPIASE